MWVVLRLESSISHIPGKCYITKLHPKPPVAICQHQTLCGKWDNKHEWCGLDSLAKVPHSLDLLGPSLGIVALRSRSPKYCKLGSLYCLFRKFGVCHGHQLSQLFRGKVGDHSKFVETWATKWVFEVSLSCKVRICLKNKKGSWRSTLEKDMAWETWERNVCAITTKKNFFKKKEEKCNNYRGRGADGKGGRRWRAKAW